MTLERIKTDNTPLPSGPYSQAIVSDGIAFISGQIPIDAMSGSIPADPRDQIRLAIHNLLSISCACGVSKENILKINVYLTDEEDLPILNEIYSEMLGPEYPTRTCVFVKGLPKNARIMIDCVGRTG